MTPAEAAFCEGVLEKWWISYREKAVRAILERHAVESDGKTVSLSAVPGSPSGLRPPVDYSGINVPLVAVCNVPPVAQCNVPPQKWLQ